MKYDLRISDEAYLDIKKAIDYYANIPVEGLEDKFRSQLRRKMQYLIKYLLSLSVKYKGMRIHNIKNFPYQIHFLLVKRQILVFGVFHERTNPNSWQNRLDY